MFNHILVHYHEIALKGKNRKFFEQRLVDNIKNALKLNGSIARISRLNGRILISLPPSVIPAKAGIQSALKNLGYVFGISSYSPTLVVETSLQKIKKAALDLASKAHKKSFKVKTKRAYKQFYLNSMEVSSDVGAYVLKNTDLRVDIKKPKTIINVEILKDKSYIYTEKINGLGGLPVGTSGRMLALISGGIDSPVASYLMMKRGCQLDFIHFHSYPFTNKASIEKVKELLGVLNKYQGKSRLYLAPIIEFQKDVVKKTEAKYRIILYRRLMYKVAEKIADKYSTKALVSGDSLGQVASQTIENMTVIGAGINTPIMRPLIGFDKEEIIDLAQRINTFNISIEPHGDCCSVFLPKNPITKARLENVLREEKKININKWAHKILEEIEILN